MDGKERVSRSARPPAPFATPPLQFKGDHSAGGNYPATQCSDNEFEGNPYEYIEEHEKQLRGTLNSNKVKGHQPSRTTFHNKTGYDSKTGVESNSSHHHHHPHHHHRPRATSDEEDVATSASSSSFLRHCPNSSCSTPQSNGDGGVTPPSSDTQSEATFTGSELALARDSTLQVRQHHGGFVDNSVDPFTPDVPPRNISMGRANSQGHGRTHNGPDREQEYDSSCLTRTPSGSVFIPSDLPKNSSPQHKASSPSNSSKKGDSLKTNPDRTCQPPYAATTVLVPNVPVRNNLRRPTSNHFSHSRFQLRKSLPTRCTWKCTAIIFIFITLVLLAALTYFAAMSMLSWQQGERKPCSLFVEDAKSFLDASSEGNSTYHLQVTSPNKAGFSESSSEGSFKMRFKRESSHEAIIQKDAPGVSPNLTRQTPGVEAKNSSEFGKGAKERERQEAFVPLPVFVEMLEGSGEAEQSDSPNSLTVENSISPFLHSKSQQNASAVVSMVTNVIHETADPSAVDVDGSSEGGNKFTLEEGFIPISSRRDNDNSSRFGVKPFSSVDLGRNHGEDEASKASSKHLSESSATTESPERRHPAPSVPSSALPPLSHPSKTLLDCVCSCPCTASTSNASSLNDVDPKNSSSGDDAQSSASYVSLNFTHGRANPNATDSMSLPDLGDDDNVTEPWSSLPNDIYPSSTTSPPPPPSPPPPYVPSVTAAVAEVDPSAVTSSNAVGETFPERVGITVVEEEHALPPEAPIISVPGPTAFPAKTLPPDGSTFMEILLSRRGTNDIPPYGHWNAQFHQPRTAFVRFNYTIPKDASIGIYGRRNAIPTHTQYDFMEILSDEEKRRKRNLKETINIVFVQYLDAGQWYLSMYNDDNKLRDVSFITAIADDLSIGCPYDCHDHGLCVRGMCECHPGYTGHDCSRSVCPVLCSGNGEYLNGHCLCKPGWKGRECNLRYDECEVPGCNGHGHCIDGKCRCAKGYKGEFCELVDCLVPDCSAHGVCVDGGCICHRGWKGDACDDVDGEVRKCLPDCSGHGKFDLEKVKCICDAKWTGPDCSKELCDINCGAFGRCESGKCHCDEGWSGSKCDVKTCDPRCNEHGQCKNGTCICIQGWNGRHCTLDGCPRNCHHHGECIQTKEGDWSCQCSGDWDGMDCSIALERSCMDGKDNDNDGLVDCEDSECCLTKGCSDNLMCVSTADPLEVLLKKQPPAVTASFFQRMRFLIEEDSVQNYVRKNAFNESRASVIRGRVVSSSGSGIVGIRVSTSNSQEGFTLTRQTGWFDLMVNGGGAVTLHFQRDPFKPMKQAIMVPWNEVIIIDNVVMSNQNEDEQNAQMEPCTEHDYDGIKPVVLATWKHEFLGGCPEKSTILAESQVLQESLKIPGTELHLVYHSSRAGGYMSSIQLQLTPNRIPTTLRLIHLRISIEGILFEKTFEADPGLKYTYAWNRRNVYRQRVYGVTTATVSVGYEYNTCKRIIWDVQTTKLSGHDMSISDIGGWNFDIHHRYNFHEGILQKGDGTNIYLRYKPRVLLTTLGNGQQRPLECPNCNGIASEQRLVAPVALAASPDGSLYVGDFNLVRRILPDRTVQTVLKLNPALVSYRYHLTVSPADGVVHLSDPERHQILRIKTVEDIPDLESNFEVLIGSGERCLPGDKNNCGDGGLAKESKLMYPKGLVFSADGLVYFADGTNIRMVDKNGLIHTLIGDHRHKGHWKPIPCHGTLNLDEVHLRWPTELAVDPLDGSLHIIDDHMILKLSQDGRLKVVAGQPLHCPSAHGSNKDNLELAAHSTLIFPESIAFAPSGELYIAESDSQRINRIRVIGTDGKISEFAGVESKCNCLERDCKCFDEEHFLASLSKMSTVSSIAVTPDGIVHIADQGNLRIRSVMATLPEPTRFREYEIYSPETQEVYVFNRYGLHVYTKNILTGKTVYTFTYNLNTSFGKLSSITDTSGNKIFMLRDYSNMVNTIENTHGQKVRLGNTRMKMLQDFIMPGSYNVTFDYHGNTGLLKSKWDSLGQSFIYQYDENGRITEAVTPSGEIVQLRFDLSIKGAEVKVTGDRGSLTSILIKGLSVTTKQGLSESQIIRQSEGSVTLNSPWGRSIITEAMAYPVLSDMDLVLGENFPVPSRQKILIQDDLVHRLEWRYFVRKEGKGRDKHVSQVVRKMKVNGDNLLAMEFDRDNSIESLLDHNQVTLLSIKYDAVGRPQRWIPVYNITPVELKYDRFGRLAQWHRGEIREQYGYDREGRLAEIRYSDGAILYYKFKDPLSGLPTAITVPSGKRYSLQYDDTGSLQSIATPRGHVHEFGIQTSLGFYKLQYTAPSMRQPFIIQYNDRGELLAKIYPGLKGRVSYVYDGNGKLQASLFGDSKIEYAYYGDTGLVKSISLDASDFDCRTDYKYHGALIKEEKVRFGIKLGLSAIKIKYQYDGNARFQRCELEINGKEIYPVNYHFNVNTGILENVMQFTVKHNHFNETIVESKAEKFSKIRHLDQYGHDSVVAVQVDGAEVFRYELVYDNRSRIRNITAKLGLDAPILRQNYSYTPDGFLEEVADRDSWKYRYDENGNIVGIVHGKKDVKLRYNEGDRLIAYGDFDMNIIDNRGFLVQKGEEKFLYNAHAQLQSAAHRNLYEVHYHYDSSGRLIARKDTHGNITQYFYTNVRQPHLVTHIHHPKSAQTYQLAYDDRGHLIHLEHRNSNSKYFVATDHLGSPLLVFDQEGSIVKEIRRSPFGALLEDTNPYLYLPVDFHGGLRDPITKLLHFGARVYDPIQTQWMTPDFENILDYLTTPQAMYLYRFRNNDPVNPRSNSQNQYYTELMDWLPLFGYNIEEITGVKENSKGHQLSVKVPSNLPVISGLGCSSDVIQREFHRLSFVPITRVKSETHFQLKRPLITRKKSIFGDGILVSRLNGKALVNVLEGASQIVQDVVVSVLNNSHFLDIHFSSHGQDIFHFVKEGPSSKVQDDHNQLQRLSGIFNVSMHDSEHGKDLKLHGHSATINIRYGTTVEQERHRLLKHARKRAVDWTWDGGAKELLIDNLSNVELRRRRSGRRRRKGRQSGKK